MPCRKKNSEAFCAFLDYLMSTVSSGKPIVYVLDNARIITANTPRP